MRKSVEPLAEMEDALEESSGTMKSDLEDSEITAQTETGSSSEEEGGGWFGSMGADFRVLASSIKTTAGGVASFVHRSALSVAAEIAALEHEEDAEHAEHCGNSSGEGGPLRLPWEVKVDENTFSEDSLLKEKIASLSSKESTFLQPFASRKKDAAEDDHDADNEDAFVLTELRIQLIRRLLELDDQLAATHARLSGRSDVRETVFWRNYFHHCTETRDEHMRLFGQSVDVASGDDMSFVCVETYIASPPTSLNSDLCYSVGDLVLVDAEASHQRP